MNKRTVGSFYEEAACRYICDNGGRIIERNYRAFRGEIDIIARDGKYLCFIEVKYRKSERFGYPEASVTLSKQKQICKISKFYLYSKVKSQDLPIRYDVVAIDGEAGAISIKWYKNAFSYL
jgi:putative endonuclease